MSDAIAKNEIRFDGLYSHPECEKDNQIYYLRFYSDGTVIHTSSSGSPHDLKTWFNKDHVSASKGAYEQDGKNIKFTVGGMFGRSEFSGEVDGLNLKLHQQGKNQKAVDHVYTFVSWDSKRHCDNWEEHAPEVTSAEMSDKELLALLENGGQLPVSYFGGGMVQVEQGDLPAEEVLPALKSFLSLDTEQRQTDARHLLAYCNSTILAVGEDVIEDMGGVKPTLDQIWNHVKVRHIFFDKLDAGKYVSKPTVYVQIEASIRWEPEHGLQMSWADGGQLVKVGPFDGHPTNGHAKADASYDQYVFYCSFPEHCTFPDTV